MPLLLGLSLVLGTKGSSIVLSASKMKLLIPIFIIAAAVGGVRASDEGLFFPDRKVEPKHEVKDGEIVMRFKAERLNLTQAVFRYDTKDKKKFWLELDFTKWADPGDFYLFKVDGKDYSGFTVRGEGTIEGGGRWALGITNADLGRNLLKKIAHIYQLPKAQAIDKTQGEQADSKRDQ